MNKFLFFLFIVLLFFRHSSYCQNTSDYIENCYSALEVYCKHENNFINPYLDLEAFLEQSQKVNKELLPQSIQRSLSDFKNRQTEECYLLFTGLPTDQNLMPTPITLNVKSHKQSFISEFCLSLFGTFIGQPFNYIQEEDGNIFRNIRPTKENVSEQTSDSSDAILELHTETAFHPLKPDFLMLYCLRTDRDGQAYTLVSELNKVLEELDEETIVELEKNQFHAVIDYSFGNLNRDKFTPEAEPIIYQDRTCVTYEHMMIADTPKGRQALEKMTSAVRKVQEKILLQPGNLLIVDNKRAIHGRTSFHMYDDGFDRWLQRMYVSTDERFLNSIPFFGRIITKQF
jgi:alpha-ketoglutarate-dependent taurine dioxygenase